MKQNILRYLKHVLLTILIGGLIFFLGLLFLGGNTISYNRNALVDQLQTEGPYVFFHGDSSLLVQYIEGDRTKGFDLQSDTLQANQTPPLKVYYPLDSSHFNVPLNTQARHFTPPPVMYQDEEPIFAVSDIESNYQTFRHFLINNRIINAQLDWTFGKGHLVLVGDFIDRSYFSTQVLWFIYYLEQTAQKQGGQVHFILGNHEIMNMQGDHRYAKTKYQKVAAILGKKQFELYAPDAFLGKWLRSKNTMERINGNLFVHGGLHPDLAKQSLSLEQINAQIRQAYDKVYFLKKGGSEQEKLLLSSKTSPYWYRGYFKEELAQIDIDQSLAHFEATVVIVGHTVQSKVNRQYEGKVIGIDVKHPKDYYSYFPKRSSEGLLIENGKYYRALADGNKKAL